MTNTIGYHQRDAENIDVDNLYCNDCYGELILDDEGWVFQQGGTTGYRAMRARELRAIADKLDELNGGKQ